MTSTFARGVLVILVLLPAFGSSFATPQVEAQSEDTLFAVSLGAQLYRLTVPERVLYASLPHRGWISGRPPTGLVPTIGFVDRIETEPGQFEQNSTLIFLYLNFKGGTPNVGGAFDVKFYDPQANWYLTVTLGLVTNSTGECEGTMPIWLRLSLGIWRMEFKTRGTESQSLFNATFTVGKYLADISVSGLPIDVWSQVELDGVPVGTINAKTSIGLGWLPEHTISVTGDIGLGEASRYYVPEPEVRVSAPGECRFEYALQHYLEVRSAYPISGSGWYDHGEKVIVSAPPEATSATDSRVVFRGWSGDYSTSDAQISVLMDAPKQITAEYTTQYMLRVISPFGRTEGSGWYDEGSSATFSVTSPVPVEGLMGILGGKYVFDHWSGDSDARAASVSVWMHAPMTVTAEWRTDYSAVYITLAVVAAVVIAVVALLVYLKRRRVSV